MKFKFEDVPAELVEETENGAATWLKLLPKLTKN